MQTLKEYIASEHNGSQVKFAAYAGVSKQQVNRWVKSGFMAHKGKLYSERRSLKK